MEHVRASSCTRNRLKDLSATPCWRAASATAQCVPAASMCGASRLFSRDLRAATSAGAVDDFRFGPVRGGCSYAAARLARQQGCNFARVHPGFLRLVPVRKELSLGIGELQSHRIRHGRLPDLREQRVHPDVLVSYFVRPGTVIYLGYGSILVGQERDLLQPVQSSVFTKVSYLWQM